jgi:hypothetical protein
MRQDSESGLFFIGHGYRSRESRPALFDQDEIGSSQERLQQRSTDGGSIDSEENLPIGRNGSSVAQQLSQEQKLETAAVAKEGHTVADTEVR